MRLGIGSYTYVWAVGVPGYPAPARPLTPTGLLEKASALGVGVVQIADRMPLDLLSAAELEELRRQSELRGIELELGMAGIESGHLARYLEIAGRVRARLIRTVTDTATHQPSVDETIALLRQDAPHFERSGVTLALENHDRFKAATLRRIIDEVNCPNIGVCLDTANSLGCSEGPDTVLETLGPRACCLHVKDYTARRLPHRFGFLIEGSPAGEGDVDIPRWLTRLRELGRDVNAILELWPGPEATLEASMAKEEQWAVRSISHLRRLIPD